VILGVLFTCTALLIENLTALRLVFRRPNVLTTQQLIGLSEAHVELIRGLQIFTLYGLTFAAMLGGLAIAAARVAEQRRAVLQSAWADARGAFLRAQLNTHFLFNILTAIATTLERNAGQAKAMLVLLCDLLNRMLALSDQQWTPLGDEIVVMESFVGLHRARRSGSVTFDVALDEGLREEYVPSLLLQPLIENAVRHGAPGDTDPLVVWIQCTRVTADDGRTDLQIVVGNAVTEGVAQQVSTGGRGLRNARELLATCYRGRATLEATRGSASRFLVTVRMPLSSLEKVRKEGLDEKAVHHHRRRRACRSRTRAGAV
jgi:LytS/YehU family sensor histidine kinase